MANIIDNEIHFSGSVDCIERLRKTISNVKQGRYVLLDGVSKIGMNTQLYRVFMKAGENTLSILCETRWSPVTELADICQRYQLECTYNYYGEETGKMIYKNGKETWY